MALSRRVRAWQFSSITRTRVSAISYGSTATNSDRRLTHLFPTWANLFNHSGRGRSFSILACRRDRRSDGRWEPRFVLVVRNSLSLASSWHTKVAVGGQSQASMLCLYRSIPLSRTLPAPRFFILSPAQEFYGDKKVRGRSTCLMSQSNGENFPFV